MAREDILNDIGSMSTIYDPCFGEGCDDDGREYEEFAGLRLYRDWPDYWDGEDDADPIMVREFLSIGRELPGIVFRGIRDYDA